MQSWNEINQWRKAKRSELLAERLALSREARERAASGIVEQLKRHGPPALHRSVGFYWPIKGEPDLRAFVRELIEQGAEAALPVVVAKNQPLEFWRWEIGTRLKRQSVWGIPVPAERIPAQPAVLLAPFIGFDEAGYRLGHGGGYYDRTLASLGSRPFVIGVGLESGRLETIYPQPHDIPLDMIVTEAGVLHGTAARPELNPASG
ncbi:MAG TPA: 5-formyltetrahydrofolate cyclo-ligase [Gammaproteobacteria bacterium]|nr:5-formyltetrahydrofolate cyclo-ligase [Gammaproteobacteria bacterium]